MILNYLEANSSYEEMRKIYKLSNLVTLYTMETKTIKISGESYRWLARIAAMLQREKGAPVSFDEAVKELKIRISARDALLAAAGNWKMSDTEAEKFEKESRKLWKTWKLSSV